MVSRFSRNWIPLLLWMAVIFTASTKAGGPNVSSYFLRPILHWIDPTMSEHTFEVVHLCARKVAHLTEYAVLGFLALRVARGEPYFARQPRPLQLAAALLFAALYASSDEFHQSFVPGRQAAVMDVLIDTTGAAVGLGITVAVARARRAM